MAGKKGGSRLNVAIIHPDRGIGGAEKLIVDAAVELASHASVSGMADKILVNSKLTASMFAKKFKHLDARGIEPAVLYPAVNVNQFNEPANSYK